MSIDVKKTLQDAGYVTVGVGVLATQQAQERRRAVQRKVGEQVRGTTDLVLARTQPLVEELRERIEPLAAQLQVLPDQFAKVIETGRERVQGPSAKTNGAGAAGKTQRA